MVSNFLGPLCDRRRKVRKLGFQKVRQRVSSQVYLVAPESLVLILVFL